MRIKVHGRYTTGQLKVVLTKLIQKIEFHGVRTVTGTNLYISLHDAEGEPMVLTKDAEKDEIIYRKTDKPDSPLDAIAAGESRVTFTNPALMTFKQPDTCWETVVDGEAIEIHGYRIRYDCETKLLIEEIYPTDDPAAQWTVEKVHCNIPTRTRAVLLAAQLTIAKGKQKSVWQDLEIDELLTECAPGEDSSEQE